MGIGYIVITSKDKANMVLEELNNNQETATIIGEIKSGNGEVEFI
jgi:phosphoribosylaminoimidazole (AIR) synthetase